MYDAVALGELLIDFTLSSTDEEGYPAMAAHPGGAPANFLAALSRFGAKTAMIGKVGADAFGKMLLRSLEENGIETKGMIRAEDVFTTLAFVTLDEKGEREFSFARKPGADTRLTYDEIDRRLLEDTKVLHFGALSMTDEPARTATVRAVECAKAAGKLISFDPNLRRGLWRSMAEAKERMLWGLSRADIVKISDDEVDFLFGCSAEEGAAILTENYGVKLAFVTCGAEGARYRNKNAAGYVPSLAIDKVRDTTGAGDIFGGAAIYGLLRSGKDPAELRENELREITQFASAAAGLSVTRPGGMSSVPDIEEIEDVLARRKGQTS